MNKNQSISLKLAEKQKELESILQLQQMSGGLVQELQFLEERLSNLADGSEAVALVLENWGSISKAISLASCKLILIILP